MIDKTDSLDDERQLVVFRLSEDLYGVDIKAVREIIRMQEITPVPNAPGFIIGVTNLRGKICPVMDMRRRFELPAARKTGDSRIVVLEIDGEDVGMLVDAVAEVLRLRQRSIEPPPLSDAFRDGNDVVEGIANLNGRLIVVFNVHRILSADSDNSVSAVAA